MPHPSSLPYMVSFTNALRLTDQENPFKPKNLLPAAIMNNQHITIERIDTPNPDEFQRFRVHFYETHLIHVTLTSNPFVVCGWIEKITWFKRKRIHGDRKLVVGLGVQWSPYYNCAAILQLCVGHRCLVFQLQQANMVMLPLRRFLSNHSNTFVGFFKYKKRRMLLNSEHKLFVRNFVDIRDLSETLGSRNASLELLANSLFGFKGVKKSRTIEKSNWNDVLLTEEQVKYASVDAFLSFRIGMHFKVWA
ncbi:Werner syndrome ATP-dependent helicase-like [Juglans microcarpa x Juglans regia]|uniref:Werner syndrome ATP-dependent helicase-like n=1 Tax=Juglans microcarpa x Juglans regia TaxID=2249226 RepID=UPI001B7E6F88|nr:Werner syndrome ATP-dependent helicase-like [Juglans microcarpa x Juglans regia]